MCESKFKREESKVHRQHFLFARSMPVVTQFVNCWQLRGDVFVREDLWISDGKILDPKLQFWDARMKVGVLLSSLI